MRLSIASLAAAAAWVVTGAAAAPSDPVRVAVDLEPLIVAAAGNPDQFAVEVPYVVSATEAGEWTLADGVATWRHAVQVPTAVSMSFSANPVFLPAGAVLAVRAGARTYVYRQADVRDGELWSRVAPGDTLHFELKLPAREQARLRFAVSGIQAGYRAFGRAAADHPVLDRLRSTSRKLDAAGANEACVLNFACERTLENRGPGRSTVGLIVANLVQCTGTLLGNTRDDGAPYVLTARHCQGNGAGGGAPGNARSLTVYWDAIATCGQDLALLYEPGYTAQTGATTVVEQQDLWLVRLDDMPPLFEPFYAGFDATGGVIVGGYSVHHALSATQQFVRWFGQAVPLRFSGASLGLGYGSDFWGTSSEVGFVGPGASGAALFDASHRVAGALSRGRENNGGPGACPLDPPAAPSADTAQVLFTSLAAAWNSTADGTSSTGSVTLASVLDPDGGAALVHEGKTITPWRLDASPRAVEVGQQVLLSWNAASAATCTALGGRSGDGWAGSLPVEGTRVVVQSEPGIVDYVLECAHPSGWTARRSVEVNWQPEAPYGVFLLDGMANRSPLWLGAPYVVSWESNQTPCELTGDIAAPITGLPSSGTTTVIFNRLGSVVLNLACGGRGWMGLGVTTVEPAIRLRVNGTDRRLGRDLLLVWEPPGVGTCTPSGGAPGDGWAQAQLLQDTFRPHVTTPGTYTYVLTCVSGTVAVTEQVTVRFADDPPYVDISAEPREIPSLGSVDFSYRTNLGECRLFWPPFNGGSIPLYSAGEGQLQLNALSGPAVYEVSMTCWSGTLQAESEKIQITVLAPPPPTAPSPNINMNVSSLTITLGQTVRLDWSASNSTECTASSSDDSWSGAVPTAGSRSFTPGTTGELSLSLTCSGPGGSVTNVARISVQPPPPPSGGGSGSGSGGGGGSIGLWVPLMLLALGAASRNRRRYKAHSALAA